MNCDDFLAAQETGGYFARASARRHAERCPRCAALRAAFAGLKQELAKSEPLSPRSRQLWRNAARQAARRVAWNRSLVFITGGLAAAACVVLLVIKLSLPRHGNVTRPPPGQFVRTTPTESAVTLVDPSAQLTGLSEAVNRLDADMQKLRLEAQRMDARREVAMTLERFDRW